MQRVASNDESAPAESIGFVTCVAGGTRDHQRYSDSDQLAAVVLRLWRIGNKDPVIAFHVDNELSAQDKLRLKSTELEPLRLADVVNEASSSDVNVTRGNLRRFRSYYCLCFAVLHSPFEATMLINADTLFVANPDQWWSLPPVQKSGVLFFEDKVSNHLWHMSASAVHVCEEVRAFARAYHYPLRAGFEEDYPDICSGRRRHQLECSLTLFNRSHVGVRGLLDVLRVLLWHVFSNTGKGNHSFHAANWGHGDKELYWIASELAGHMPYFSPRGPPAAVGPKRGATKRATCYAHLEPIRNPGRTTFISHLNMAHDCGWDGPTDGAHNIFFREGAPLWKSQTGQSVRTLTQPEARMFDAFKSDVSSLSAKSTSRVNRSAGVAASIGH